MASSDSGGAINRRLLYSTMALAALAAVAIAALLVNIFEHKQEARNPFYRVVELNDTIEDPAIWGKDFSHAVRPLPAHRRPAAHAIWRQ